MVDTFSDTFVGLVPSSMATAVCQLTIESGGSEAKERESNPSTRSVTEPSSLSAVEREIELTLNLRVRPSYRTSTI